MTLSTYWWSPRREVRGAVGEAIRHNRAWAHLLRHGDRRLLNFGDEVSPWLVEELTGTRPRWSPVDRADLVCVGSIIDAYARRGGSGHVLGAGIRSPSTAHVSSVAPDRLLLVRGRATRAALGAGDAIPLGDPGLVISNVVPPGGRRRGGVVVVPHFAALGHREVRRLLDGCRAQGWRVLLPNLEPLEMARAISAADLVLTSSLHGLVFADAYGVPGQLVTMLEGASAEPGFKYDDYSSALDAETTAVPLATILRSPDHVVVIDGLSERSAAVASRLDGVVGAIYRAAHQLR